MSSFVSIVIPVYNVDKNLFQMCVHSVLDQTYRDFEVILVNDGSTDSSDELCDKFAKADSRVRVIHQKNQGVSAARNNGTAEACGEYIMYVDADDLLAPYALEEGLFAAKNTNADMVMAGIVKISKSEAFWDCIDAATNEYTIYEKTELDILKRHYMISLDKFKAIKGNGYINRGPYSRMIAADLAKKNRFLEGMPLGEDVLWNMALLDKCEKICIVNNIWYGYLIHGASAIRKYYGNREYIVSLYLKRLWDENQEFFKTHVNDYAKNAAVEFYCILNYELLSDKCDMTKREKKLFVRQCISKEPWKLLYKKEVNRSLPKLLRVLLLLCSSGLWLELLTLRKKISK